MSVIDYRVLQLGGLGGPLSDANIFILDFHMDSAGRAISNHKRCISYTIMR